MRRQTLLTLLTAAMLVLAGCAGSTGGDGSPTTDGTTTPDVEPDDGDDGDSAGGTATGTVQFYVSDDPGQIEDFRHLNVTITQIGFQRADGGEMANESDDEEVENETETPDEETETPENETETPEDIDDETTTNTTTNETTTDGGSASDASGTSSELRSDGGVAVAPQADNHENGTETPDDMDGNETESDGEMDGNESDEDGEMESDEDGETEGEDGESRDGWVTHDVDSRTVDLTQLKGDNATLIDSPELPAGNYSKVFVHVSDINATLTDGSSVNVKLPSNKLQLNKGFTLEPNGTVSFVYDITVFKAGNSGKYILKPVISQSGPDQQVNDIDDRSDEREDEEEEEEQEEDDEEDADDSEPEAGTPEKGGPPEDRGKN